MGRFFAEDAFRNHFDMKMDRKWTPGTLKIKVFTWKVFKIHGFHGFSNLAPKCTPWSARSSQNGCQMTSRSGPGSPRSGPRRPQELPGAPQERPRSAPREPRSRPRGPGDPKSAPRAPQEQFWSEFGAAGTSFRSFFGAPGASFSNFSRLQCYHRFGRLFTYPAACRSCFHAFQGSMGRRVPALALTIRRACGP